MPVHLRTDRGDLRLTLTADGEVLDTQLAATPQEANRVHGIGQAHHRWVACQAVHYEEDKGTSVALKNELKIGLWAGDSVLMSKLVVKPTDLSIAAIRNQAVPFADLPDVRYYTITGIRDGEVKIEARLGEGGPVWAWMPLEVGAGLADSNSRTGQIIFVGGISMVAGGMQADFLREMYRNGNEEILKTARTMMSEGKTESEAARWVVEARNNLKLAVRNEGPGLFKKLVEYRNNGKYGNPIGPSYEELRAAGKADSAIIAGVRDTSKEFNAVGGKMRLIGTVGEVVGFALTATQNSPEELPPLPRTEKEQLQIEAVRLRLNIPASANIDKHGHLKKGSYLQIDTFDPHAGDEMASETEEILWALGVDITYHFGGVTWTVPGRPWW
jgi:hypothetical protein